MPPRFSGPTGELRFKTWAKKELERRFPGSWWYAPPTRAERGIPDLLGCVRGWMIPLELKLDRAAADRSREVLQGYVLSKIREAGSPLVLNRVTPTTFEAAASRIGELYGPLGH